VAAEVAVFGALTLYLVNRVAALEQRVANLEREIVVVAKKEARVEQSHATALRSLLEGGVRQPSHQPVDSSIASHVHNRPTPAAHVHSHAEHTHHHPPPQRKVTFNDDPEEVDEELMEQEFGDDDPEESSESPPARRKPSGKSKGRSKIKVVTMPSSKGRKGKDMDDVRAKAAAMQREAEADP
jgi:hypothetical protein